MEDIVAFHKPKREFVSLKEMESEDTRPVSYLRIKGYDFEILAN